MSRRSDNDAAAVLGCLFLLVMPFVWLFSWMWEKSKTPLPVQLRQLDRPQFWGEQISQQVCPQCQAVNEEGRHYCFGCNSQLTPQPIADSPDNSDYPGWIILVILFIGFMIMIAIANS